MLQLKLATEIILFAFNDLCTNFEAKCLGRREVFAAARLLKTRFNFAAEWNVYLCECDSFGLVRFASVFAVCARCAATAALIS